ncbi:MAG: helix-turn-helix domain-containing protein [Ethanoligenens sp.]
MGEEPRKVTMLTINEAARRVPGLTRYRIRAMCINGELPCVRAGRKYLICEQVLVQYLTQPHTAPVAPQSEGIRKINEK